MELLDIVYSRDKNQEKYKNTIIYQLTCKDENVTDTYIGHTTNIKRRMADHCKDSLVSCVKLYEFIRSHGGWENWHMNILGTYSCKNLGQASRIEWYWWNKLGGTLNTVRPGTNYIKRDMYVHKLTSTSYIEYMEYACRIPKCEHDIHILPPSNYPRNFPKAPYIVVN